MVSVNTNLNNFSYWDILLAIFGKYSSDFKYTAAGIFRRTMPPACLECDMPMNYNGYNTYGKKGLGSVKIGRYICPSCRESCEEERDFWENLKGEFFGVIDEFCQLMRLHHLSYQGIHDSKDTATITAFLAKYLDPTKRTFVVTDLLSELS